MDSQGARRSPGGLSGRPQEPGWTLRAPTGARVDSQGAHRSTGGLSGRPQEHGWTLRVPTGARVDSQGAHRSDEAVSSPPGPCCHSSAGVRRSVGRQSPPDE